VLVQFLALSPCKNTAGCISGSSNQLGSTSDLGGQEGGQGRGGEGREEVRADSVEKSDECETETWRDTQWLT